MQSILFIMRYFLDDSKDSLAFKFRNQIQAAKNLGLDVWNIAFENNNIYLAHESDKIKLLSYKVDKEKSLFNSIYLYLLLYKSILKALDVKKDFDFVYIRDMTTMPTLLKCLKIFKKNGSKLILEIPTYPSINEDKSEKRRIRKIIMYLDNKMNPYRNKYVDLYTLIGDKTDMYMGKPALNIDNGICLDIIPERVPQIIKEEIHCLGLASMSRWHGYDRFIRGMFEYKESGGKEKIVLHLAGNGGDGSLQQWKELSITYKLENEVIIEGTVYGSKLIQLVNQCDVGIATLAGYRINLGNSSTLKIREYTARGLPFIYSVEDKVLVDGLNFALRVPDENTPIDMNVVLEFVRKTRSEREMEKSMRKYAQENMSWEKQFLKVVSFFS